MYNVSNYYTHTETFTSTILQCAVIEPTKLIDMKTSVNNCRES